MADALFEIGRETENWQLNRKFVQGTTAWWDVSLVSHICIGYLPLPKDASSPAVAETAGKWLSRCDAEDIGRAMALLLTDEVIEALLVRGEQEGKDGTWVSLQVIHSLAQEVTDD